MAFIDDLTIFELMQKYQTIIHFISRKKTLGIVYNSSSIEERYKFKTGLLDIFSEKDIHNESIHKFYNPLIYNDKIKNDIFLFIQKNNVIFPELNGLKSFFNELSEKSLFIILLDKEITTELSLYLHSHLSAWENNEDVNLKVAKSFAPFKRTFEKYKMFNIGIKRISIGEPVRKERKCRFCGLSMPLVSFKMRAHAFSEGLGNKNVILFDECDNCNTKFGKNIECDLISYLEIYRLFFGIKGKGGSKNISGINFNASRDGNGKINLNMLNIEDRPLINEEPYSINLQSRKINSQNLYKTLVKYFISVIDQSELSKFKETISWINGEINSEKLPIVCEAIDYGTFTEQPILIYYLRKSIDTSIPYALCQFYFSCKIFQFVVPFCTSDSEKFNNHINWKNTNEFLPNLDFERIWTFNDFSNNELKKLIFRLDHWLEKK